MAARAWETLAEPVMTQYAAVKGGTWHEVDDHILPGKEPAFIFQKSYKRPVSGELLFRQ